MWSTLSIGQHLKLFCFKISHDSVEYFTLHLFYLNLFPYKILSISHVPKSISYQNNVNGTPSIKLAINTSARCWYHCFSSYKPSTICASTTDCLCILCATLVFAGIPDKSSNIKYKLSRVPKPVATFCLSIYLKSLRSTSPDPST